MPLSWSPEDIVYHVFPDRFFNGDPSNDVTPGAFTFHGKPARSSRDRRVLTGSQTHQHTFFGGDLQGVQQKIPYLQDLGVTALVMCPIFTSRSTHKYDTDDYLQVDPHLGGDRAFEALRAALRKAGIKLMLDGVFNHTSFEHPWHRDHRDYYCLDKRGNALTWMNWGVLPKLNPENPPTAEALLAVIDHWGDIDGWRLDASHLLPTQFLARLKERFRHHNPQGIVIGEDWENAKHHLEAGLYDGVTNFLFRRSLEQFFVGDAGAETFAWRTRVYLEGYPTRELSLSWNLLDNHDTGRMLDMLGGSSERMRLAVAMAFTMPGTPLIYQGDEVGMRGRNANESRAPMQWEPSRWDRKIGAAFGEFISLRKSNPVFAYGGFRWLHANNADRTLVYERSYQGKRAIVALNDSDRPKNLSIDGKRIHLDAHGVEVLLA